MAVTVYEYPQAGQKLMRVAQTNRCSGDYEASFYEYGKFSLSIHAGAAYSSEFQINRIVQIDNKYCGIIKNRKVQRGASNVITVSGYQLKGLFWQRVTIPLDLPPNNAPAGYDSKAGYTDEIMKYFIGNNTSGSRRGFENFLIDKLLNQGNQDDRYYTRFEVLGDVIAKIAKRSEVGWDIVIDEVAGWFKCVTIKGQDRTISQSDRQRAVFDLAIGTISSFEYVEETENAANVFYCTKSGSEFEDEALTQTYFLDNVEKTGIERIERHLNISIDNDDDLFTKMEENSRKDMESYRPVQSISVIATKKLVPHIDYDVGDYASFISREDGIRANRQITAIKTTINADKISYTITLGDSQLDKFDFVQRDIKNK